jgi:IS30 family transposase
MAKHLTMQERKQIAEMHAALQSQKRIAAALGRHRTTIGRELARNRERFAYCPFVAQQKAEERRRRRPLVPKMERPEIVERVRCGLEQFHSPDQIAGRMKRDNPLLRTRVSRQTIYNWIRSRPVEENWRRFLRYSKHNKRGKTGQIVRPVDIAGRPAEARQRLVVGHWEGDTMWGAERRGGLVTLVDRKSRFVMLARTKDSKARRVRLKLQQLLNQLPPEKRRSATFDRGKEFAEHELLALRTQMPVFFAAAYCPWQRGTCENTNGLIRQFLPRGTPITAFSPQRIADVAGLLNHRPRRVLGYLTPSEIFHYDSPRAIES